MFQFTRFPLPVLCVQTGVPPHDGWWVSPFGHPRIGALSAAPRGLTQPDTSFIGSRRQGIHRWLFVAWKFHFILYRCSCSLCNSQGASRGEDLKRQGRPAGAGRCLGERGAWPPRGWERTFKTEERTTARSAIVRRGRNLRFARASSVTSSQCINLGVSSSARPDGRASRSLVLPPDIDSLERR